MDRVGSTRRTFMAGAAAVGGTAALAAAGTAAAAGADERGRHRRPRPSVAVLGGGVAGLTAAHELAERGFRVTVYERRALGGKARSMDVPNSAKGGRRPLPAEHGFRFIPGIYHNLPDTMRRIPFPGNANGVWDNLVAPPRDVVRPRPAARTYGSRSPGRGTSPPSSHSTRSAAR